MRRSIPYLLVVALVALTVGAAVLGREDRGRAPRRASTVTVVMTAANADVPMTTSGWSSFTGVNSMRCLPSGRPHRSAEDVVVLSPATGQRDGVFICVQPGVRLVVRLVPSLPGSNPAGSRWVGPPTIVAELGANVRTVAHARLGGGYASTFDAGGMGFGVITAPRAASCHGVAVACIASKMPIELLVQVGATPFAAPLNPGFER